MSHTAAGRALGISQAMIDGLGAADENPLFTDEERAAIALARELTATAKLSVPTFERAAAHFDKRQLVEIVVSVGVANLNNRFIEAFSAQLEQR